MSGRTAGADWLVAASANTDPFERDHDAFAPARAPKDGPPYLCADRVGRGEAFTLAGCTMAVSADEIRLAEFRGSEAAVSASLSTRDEEASEEPRPVTWKGCAARCRSCGRVGSTTG